MTTVSLKPGDTLTIKLDDDDGGFEVHYDSFTHPGTLLIKETANLSGNIIGKGGATLYQEDFLTLPLHSVDTVYGVDLPAKQ